MIRRWLRNRKIRSLRAQERDLSGMSLRDYFAAKALQGMHARDSYDKGLASPEQRARICYIDADAMLAERAK